MTNINIKSGFFQLVASVAPLLFLILFYFPFVFSFVIIIEIIVSITHIRMTGCDLNSLIRRAETAQAVGIFIGGYPGIWLRVQRDIETWLYKFCFLNETQ